ncbi:response regulator transcription factor [Streptoalloteichus hindustanus]|uniref:DNA-binding response regulator, NarL/FixJ family, contains REC and HTH domains n=1 Tax=Streptoalloteichus hindustanus TaxID=2017 RepID=A0A1M5F9F8_STRHI|nr:LuxR family transcriptional regulator [Streptoalloteichus hindustanus]SHF88165.1 DNA-binding response regulator, NarL/FixJ family, contains REC and HTH domains [Streptoalloteichus hindustanus]
MASTGKRITVSPLGSGSPFWVGTLAGLRECPEIEVVDGWASRPGDPEPDVVLVERPDDAVRRVLRNAVRTGGDSARGPRVLVFDDGGEAICHHQVHGVLPRNCSAPEVVAAIRVVAAGYWLTSSPPGGRSPGGRSEPRVDPAALDSLSDRELDVLLLIARGCDNGAISRKLFLSTSTVKSHVRRLFAKLGIRHRTEAVGFAYETGLVEPLTSAPPARSASPG